MKQGKYEYAFGQWVLDEGDYKHRYLGKNITGQAILYDSYTAEKDITHHDKIRPDPDPPELVAGQLVMVRDDGLENWEGPYEYVGHDGEENLPHVLTSIKGEVSLPNSQHAKPYIPEPEDKPEPAQLDAIRAELSDLKAYIQKIEQRLPG